MWSVRAGEYHSGTRRKEAPALATPRVHLGNGIPPGAPNFLASPGHAGRTRVVWGHILNTLRHMLTRRPHNVLRKFTILCRPHSQPSWLHAARGPPHPCEPVTGATVARLHLHGGCGMGGSARTESRLTGARDWRELGELGETGYRVFWGWGASQSSATATTLDFRISLSPPRKPHV